MKIEGTNRVNPIQAYQNNGTRNENSSKVRSKKTDQLEISSEAQSLLTQGDEVKTDPSRIENLRNAIQQGTYQVDSRLVAEKLYNKLFTKE